MGAGMRWNDELMQISGQHISTLTYNASVQAFVLNGLQQANRRDIERRLWVRSACDDENR